MENKEDIILFREYLINIINKIKRSLLTSQIENKVNSKVNGVQRLFLNEKFAITLSYSSNVFVYALIRTIFRTRDTLTPFKSIEKVREEVKKINYPKLNEEKKKEIIEKNKNAQILHDIIQELNRIEKNISENDLELFKFLQTINILIKENETNGEYRYGESLLLVIEIIKKYGLLQNLEYNDLTDYLKEYKTNVNIRNELALMYQDYKENINTFSDNMKY